MRVLVVEDEKRMAELLKKGLEEEHHSVTLTSKFWGQPSRHLIVVRALCLRHISQREHAAIFATAANLEFKVER